MQKFHKAQNNTDCAIGVDINEYNYLVRCHAILQMIFNFTGYDKGPIVDTAAEMFKELNGGGADV